MLRESKSQRNDNVKVIVRVRPPLQRQLEGDIFISTVQVHPQRKKIQLFEYYNLETLTSDDLESYIDNPYNYSKHEYTFDHIYDDESNQEEVYENTARLSVCSALEGYNATIFAYGQTGTGKTYTMEGFRYNMVDDERGIVPRAVEDIFRYIQSCEDEDTTFMVRASYIQIYNEVISDLLRNEKKNLQIREDARKGVYIEGVSEWAVVKPQEILELMKIGAKSRATAKTNMNEYSSRSHAVFIITIEQMREVEEEVECRELKVAKLNLVDLAGSERVRVTGASGKRLDECKKINLSLSCLGMVIAALTESRQQEHIPYRNSVLTRLLSDSLGGNCKTTMLTMISPAPEAFQESLSSLKFAHRAKSIRNRPAINEDLDQKALIRKYETELRKLRGELEQKNQVLIDKSKLIQLEEEKKQIEEDKNNVMKALQQRSNEFFKEREQKKLLEEKIKAFNSQLIHGGGLSHNPSLEKILHDQKKLIADYEKKISSLQAQNEPSELTQELFQKQSEILNTLTNKINERDEVNQHLNEELYAYDQITKEREELIESKKCRIQLLEKLLAQHGIPVPNQQEGHYEQRSTRRADGVELEGGQITYSITENNTQKCLQEINVLKEVNGQQKKQIVRLKEEISKKNSERFSEDNSIPQSSGKVKDSQEGFVKIKNSIDLITNGLRKKENTDMKVIIDEIFKIKKVVEEKTQNSSNPGRVY